MFLLRKYRIRKAGSGGHIISLPNEYMEDVKLEAGQRIAMYRDGENLVLIPESKTTSPSLEPGR